MSRPLRVLVVEDSPEDAVIVLRELKRAGYDVLSERVETEADFLSALERQPWDIVLSDFAMPEFNGLRAFDLLKEREIEIPFIFVSGRIGEDRAAEAMKRGASDYILKDKLARLVPAVERELQDAEARRQRRQMAAMLKESEEKYKGLVEGSLQGIAIHLNRKLVFANRAMLNIFGYGSVEELLALPDVISLFAPEERERVAAYAAARIGGGEVPGIYECRGIRKDGTRIWMEIFAWQVHWQGYPAIQFAAVDITQRRQAEQSLQEREHQLSSIYNTVADIIFQLAVEKDGRYRFVSVNQAFRTVTGLEQDQVVGKWVHEVIPEPSLTTVLGKYAEAIRDRKIVRWEETSAYPTGRLTGEVNVAPIFDDAGTCTHLVGAVHDITARKQAEERFRAIIENAQDVITVLDAKGVFRLVSPSVQAQLGYTSEELIGQSATDFVHPEDLPRVQGALAEALQAPGKASRVELRHRHKDGSWRHYEVVGKNLLSTPAVGGLLGMLRDITARKRAEEELAASQRLLQTVFDTLPLWVSVRDREGRYLLLNRSMVESLGLSESAWRGMTRSQIGIGTPEEAEQTEQLGRQVIDTGEGRDDPHVPITMPDGKMRTFHVVRRPLRDDAGQVQGLVSVSQDITEQLVLEEQFRQAQKMESIGQLAGGVAHDFNNMLAVILSFTESAMEQFGTDDPIRADLREVLEAGNRAAALTRQLLAFSRRQIFELQPIRLNDLVSGLKKFVGRLIGEDIRLDLVLSQDTPPVMADEGQMEQVLINLVVNARDAMPEGGRLLIELAPVTLDQEYAERHASVKPGEYVQLTVTDTGTGMDQTVLHHIFEPFFTTKEQGKGTGLGLATVYGIVKQLGGNIWVYSELGKGTTFKIYLPCAESSAAATTKAQRRAVALGGHETILLVEDDAAVRRAARRILEGGGYKVVEAANGQEALTLVTQGSEPIGLLLSDVVMPEMGGRELAERFDLLHPGTPVIYMSGYTDNAIAHQGTLDPDTVLVQKPFTRESLLRKVRETLDQSRTPSGTA